MSEDFGLLMAADRVGPPLRHGPQLGRASRKTEEAARG